MIMKNNEQIDKQKGGENMLREVSRRDPRGLGVILLEVKTGAKPDELELS